MTICAVLKRKPDKLEEIIAFSQGCIEGDLRQLWNQDQEEFKVRMKRKWAEISIAESLLNIPLVKLNHQPLSQSV